MKARCQSLYTKHTWLHLKFSVLIHEHTPEEKKQCQILSAALCINCRWYSAFCFCSQLSKPCLYSSVRGSFLFFFCGSKNVFANVRHGRLPAARGVHGSVVEIKAAPCCCFSWATFRFLYPASSPPSNLALSKHCALNTSTFIHPHCSFAERETSTRLVFVGYRQQWSEVRHAVAVGGCQMHFLSSFRWHLS